MQYCEKCRRLCEDGAAKCPGCRSGKLRPAGERDMAFLCQCNLYMAERLEQALTRADIPHKVEDAGKGAYYTFDMESMPTDKRIYVQAGQMEQAQALAVQVNEEIIQEQGGQQEDAPPPTLKRLVGEILSVVAFLVLIMLAVYSADSFTSWLKSIFGMG